MKRKITKSLFLTASIVAVTLMFSSCKDTYQDYRTEFQSQIDYQASVSETLKSQVSTLTNELSNLKALQEECQAYCGQKMEELDAKIKDLQTLVDALKASSEAGDANLQAQITELNNQIAAQESEIETLKNEIADLKAQDALFQSAIDTLTSSLAEVKEQVATNTKNIADLLTSVNAINEAATSAAAMVQEALGMIAQNTTGIAALQETVNTINSTIAGWGDRLTAVETAAAEAAAKATANEARIKALEELTKTQAEAIATLKSSVETLSTTTQGLATTVNALTETLNQAAAAIAEYATKFDQAVADLEAAKTLLEQVATLAGEAKAMAAQALAQNAATDVKLEAAVAAFEQADQAMQEAISALQTAVTELQGQIAKLTKSYNELITSIVIQGTWNPFYGEVAIPMDVRSNMLIALYNEAVNDVYFPTDKPSCYVDADAVPTFTEGDIEVLKDFNTYWFDAQDVVIDEEEGNAGTVYLTVNPSNVDFTGTQFSLVNSLDEESGVKLGALKASDHLLTYGWTRAENGFYEAKATVAAEDIESIKMSFDLQNIKSVASDLRNILNRSQSYTSLNLTDIFTNLQDELSGILEADGIKATWTDADGQQKSVYSQYGIAATAIKPLSFSFLKDFDTPKLPHISPFDYTVNMHLNYSGFTDVPYPSLNIKIDTDGDGIDETYTIDGIDALIDDINEKIGGSLSDDINELITQINDQVNEEVSNALNKVNTQVISRVNSLITKINNGLSNVNQYLQPCLIYQANDGTYYQTSTTWYAPSHFTLNGTGEQGITLTPTSYTAEMLAPAFKKFVAVTNVYTSDFSTSAQDGNATCKAALAKANSAEGMNAIHSGAKDVLFLTDSKYAGCVYEILYTAVDYSGKVVANKYYVKVK